ncbi:UDP-N-acetylmuramate dehydrogenase [Glaciihabitans arcticus]|uniref:UDP-N-acetylenolpyruvoylglucosamine reductase n=1 Tax=Glaciihabitans arcticus TaxID=2668039 RepID=A0A4Q9GQI7_9MICO|nr:UDP-N-acetylmuramate dehydrogenase [Glaciihabitans arcticus]TBN55515.1 UDP-N-acetylmuramate dehydrogenase [Glaciihabitans arcticus]
MPSDLSAYTTLRVGGPARLLIDQYESLVDTMREVWESGEPWLVLGGGSNVVIGDEGFDGSVVRITDAGFEARDNGDGTVRVRASAGHSWDALVAETVSRGWAGIEGLSGIPGTCGAAPIQNIGAYGQELASVLVSVEFLDYLTGDLVTLSAAELELSYRHSALKGGRLGVVLSIDLALTATADGLSEPIAYDQLAGALGVALGARVPLADVRASVLQLRASKGMVLDPTDPDTASAGSFFTNPIVGENFARTLPEAAPRWLMEPEPADRVVPLGEEPAPPAERSDFRVKLSAAWLIERAGIRRGFSLPGSKAAISSKHTLAITNTGGATATEISELARYVQTRVFSEFGVRLQPEPVFIGLEL